jgi:MHS family proline/betaine transporter-like MFS transporter
MNARVSLKVDARKRRSMTTADTFPPKALELRRADMRRLVAATSFGNFMEYVDFATYGFLASIIGATFFPQSSPTAQLLSSLAVFGVSFLFRPLGGLVFGYLGDKIGRKRSLVSSIIIMSVATAAIGCLPSFAVIGVAAPILLVVLRIVQGISVGGEFSVASTFIVEHAPNNRRGFFASSILVTSGIGTVAGNLLVLLLTSTLSTDQMSSFGWRIPFWIALPLGAIGLYMRLRVEESPIFEKIATSLEPATNPWKAFKKKDFSMMLLVAAFCGANGLSFFYYATYFNNYLSTTRGFSRQDALLLSVISLTIYSALCPLAGMLIDRIGRRKIFIAGFFALAILVTPIFYLLGTGFWGALVGMIIFGIPLSITNTTVSVLIVELFGARMRTTAGAIGHEVGVGMLSGSGPLVAAALVAGTGNPIIPAYYLGGILAVAGVLLVLFLPESGKRSLLVDGVTVEDEKAMSDAAVSAAVAAEAH